MPDDLDKLRELVPMVAADKARLDAASKAKVEADCALLLQVIEIVRPALPAICFYLSKDSKERGIELVPGKAGTILYESGDLDEDPEWIVRHFNIKTMIETLVNRLESSRRDLAALKLEKHVERVKAALTLLKAG